jgi:hypothetical protein
MSAMARNFPAPWKAKNDFAAERQFQFKETTSIKWGGRNNLPRKKPLPHFRNEDTAHR